jgi:hypothetical protein
MPIELIGMSPTTITKAVAELAVKGDGAEGSQSLYVEHNQSED